MNPDDKMLQSTIKERYKIIKLLGKGGTGSTYEALDLQTDQKVALKRLDLASIKSWKTHELFKREARVLQALNHPNIPGYVDHFSNEKEHSFYIAQTLAPGRSLEKLVEKGWHPTEKVLKNLATQVLKTLVYLQSIHPPVFHRDIKPQNILWSDEGKLSLVDFGAVRDTYTETVSGGETIVGTFGYMAPEQLRGVANQSTDGYGLGATLLFILTGRSPDNLPQIRMRFDLSRLTTSNTFTDWIARLVEPIHEDRFPSAQHALTALRSLGTRTTRISPPKNESSLIRSERPSSLAASIFGAPMTLHRTMQIDRPLSEKEQETALELIQDTMNDVGRFSQIGSQIRWEPSYQQTGRTNILFRLRDERTDVIMFDNFKNVAGGYFGGIGGGVGGGVGGGLVYLAYEIAGTIGAIFWVFGVTFMALFFARILFLRVANKRIAQFDALEIAFNRKFVSKKSLRKHKIKQTQTQEVQQQ